MRRKRSQKAVFSRDKRRSKRNFKIWGSTTISVMQHM
jgi:hypothetical protein